jgi:glycosyltransferase involved in cell wall biosynthesis
MLSMVHSLATRHWEGWGNCVKSWYETASKSYPAYMVYNKPLLVAYNEVLENTDSDIIAYMHDDVMLYEQDWDLRVLREFKDTTVGMVGFGGARGHGDPDMYQKPYQLVQLARRGFMSNMRTAEAHGARFNGERDVAVFDGFALFVRRFILDEWGGWPVGTPINYWVYDYAISCEVRRQGFRNRFVGVDCEHLGGKSPSIVPNEDIEAAHRWLYDRYRDVLPYEAL